MNQTTSLFRKEVLESRTDRLYGNVHIFLPLSWHFIGYGMLACLVLTSMFLTMANYAQVVHVNGHITLDKGVAKITAAQRGIVTSIFVSDGQEVKKGQPLMRIRSGLYLRDNVTVPYKMLQSLKHQSKLLAFQIDSLKLSQQAEKLEIQSKIKGLQREIARIITQISIQRRLIYFADKNYHRFEQLARQSLVSQQSLESSATTLALKQQILGQLQEHLENKRTSLMSNQRQILYSHASISAQIADISVKRAKIEQQIAQVQSEQGYLLVAPFDGTITGVTAKIGQPTSQSSLMLVVPKKAHIEAELDIPTKLIGFLKVGQQTRLLIDAFPYERFGTVSAKINYISTAAEIQTTAGSLKIPLYLVTVSIEEPWVRAFGKKQPLIPGMVLSARIQTQKQTLLEWLFEPLFAVTKR